MTITICATCKDYIDDPRLRRATPEDDDPQGVGWVHVVNNSGRCPGQGDDATNDYADPEQSSLVAARTDRPGRPRRSLGWVRDDVSASPLSQRFEDPTILAEILHDGVDTELAFTRDNNEDLTGHDYIADQITRLQRMQTGEFDDMLAHRLATQTVAVLAFLNIVGDEASSGGHDWAPADRIDDLHNEMDRCAGEVTVQRLMLVQVPAHLKGQQVTDWLTDWLDKQQAPLEAEDSFPAIRVLDARDRRLSDFDAALRRGRGLVDDDAYNVGVDAEYVRAIAEYITDTLGLGISEFKEHVMDLLAHHTRPLGSDLLTALTKES